MTEKTVKETILKGKIIKGIAGFYYVHGEDGILYECKAKGVFRNKKIKPLVGDNVEITVLDPEKGEGNIDCILPRSNTLIRPAAANVDQAMVVFAICHPEPNLNLLDRFLVMMDRLDIPVSVVFNKIDLAGEEQKQHYRDIYEKAGYEVLFISTVDQSGISDLRERLRGKTTVLAGPSGVGKSSLTNLLHPDAQMETGGISEKIQRGKHTTRHSQLFCTAPETYMMDTPGFSSMYVEDMEAEELKDSFPEFSKYEDGCKFLGCVHVGEKVCGVKEAVEAGQISRSRYENYLLFYQELKDKRRY